MLALTDKWVWDFWFADDDRRRHHIFYLQAPRSLGDPELRHHNASIGHAVSDDLRTWTVLPDALRPGQVGEWDDLATWTGSVIRDGDLWRMLYTGVCRQERGLVQRVGLATSDDLLHWEKHPANPVLQSDSRWYEQLGSGRWRDESWRDPFLYRVEGDDACHVLVTARSSIGPCDGAGVVGRARSNDFVHWEVLAPLTEPGEFAQVEVPQYVDQGTSQVVLFSCLAEDHSAARRRRLGVDGQSGTFAFVRVEDGPFLPTAAPIAEQAGEILYAGKLIVGNDGTPKFVAFRGATARGGFVGELTGPLGVEFHTTGTPVVAVA